MSKIEITGAKLVGGLFCHYAYREEIGKNRHDFHKGVKSERPVHEDLVKAFQALAVHLPVILQDIEPGQIVDINSDVNNFKGTEEFKEMLEKYNVFEVIREIEEGRAQLIGTKALDLGTLGVETPMIRYEGSYYYKLEFQFAIDRLMKEVELYREGKQAPEAIQPELFDQPQEEPEKPKKKLIKGKKKKEGCKRQVGTFDGPSAFLNKWDGLPIINEEDAEPGDIIGVDAADGSPIIMQEGDSYTVTASGPDGVAHGVDLNKLREFAGAGEAEEDPDRDDFNDEPTTEDEFSQPQSAFQIDPSKVV